MLVSRDPYLVTYADRSLAIEALKGFDTPAGHELARDLGEPAGVLHWGDLNPCERNYLLIALEAWETAQQCRSQTIADHCLALMRTVQNAPSRRKAG